jgi:hypothetical protein
MSSEGFSMEQNNNIFEDLVPYTEQHQIPYTEQHQTAANMILDPGRTEQGLRYLNENKKDMGMDSDIGCRALTLCIAPGLADLLCGETKEKRELGSHIYNHTKIYLNNDMFTIPFKKYFKERSENTISHSHNLNSFLSQIELSEIFLKVEGSISYEHFLATPEEIRFNTPSDQKERYILYRYQE